MNFIKKYLAYMIIGIVVQQSSYAQQIVTNPVRSDGFGAQFQTIIYSVLWAELNHAKYVYSPIQRMEHNYDNDPDFIAKKEWMINFIGNYEVNKGNAHQFNIWTVIGFFERNLVPCCSSDALKRIKAIFRENKNRDDYFNSEYFNIVVHIRRHNAHDCRIDGTNTPDAIYLEIINKLRLIYKDKNPIFHIQSQGNVVDFARFNAPDVILHLNETIEDSFISMVFADALVTSRSSFSYTAGILSEGTVYYIPFWHPPLPGWISTSNL